MLALYVNGVQAGQLLIAGSIVTSISPLKIGGNAIWGEWFQGQIDEVRVYNRVLTAGEIHDRHEHRDHEPGCGAAVGTGSVVGDGRVELGAVVVGCGERQRGCFALQRASRLECWIHAVAREPGWAAHWDELCRHGRDGHVFYRVIAEDAAGNSRPALTEARATVGDSQRGLRRVRCWRSARLGGRRCRGGADGQRRVVRYNVHRGTSAALRRARELDRAADGNWLYRYHKAGQPLYKVTAEDAAGNISPVSNEAAATVTADTTAPSQPAGLAGSVVGSTVNLSWTASTDNIAVTPLQRPPLDHAGFTPSAGNRIAQPTGTSYTDTGLATGTYFYKVTAEDAAGNISPASNEASATVDDAAAPSAPGTLTATAAGSNVNAHLGRGDRQRRRQPLQRPPRQHQRLHPQHRQPDRATNRARATPTPASAPAATSTSSPPKTPPATSAPSPTPPAPPSSTPRPPTTPTNLAATGAAGQANLTWTAATDNVAVSRYNLHRSTSSGFTPSAGNRIAQPTGTSYNDTGLSAGTYHYKLTAEDAAGNISPASTQATATVTTPPVTGLVAAYGFDETSGTTAADQSGANNVGTLSNATRGDDRQVRRRALASTARTPVNVADSASLDLTTGMTLEAWVRPAVAGDWRTAVAKDQPGNLAYGLYSSTNLGSRAPSPRRRLRHGRQTPPRRSPSAAGATLRRPTTGRRSPLRQRRRRLRNSRCAGSIARPTRRFTSAATASGASTSTA